MTGLQTTLAGHGTTAGMMAERQRIGRSLDHQDSVQRDLAQIVGVSEEQVYLSGTLSSMFGTSYAVTGALIRVPTREVDAVQERFLAEGASVDGSSLLYEGRRIRLHPYDTN